MFWLAWDVQAKQDRALELLDEHGDEPRSQQRDQIYLLRSICVNVAADERQRALVPAAPAMTPWSEPVLLAVMPRVPDVQVWTAAIGEAMSRFGITTPARMAGFLAHVAHESNECRSLTENLRYSAKRLRAVWPSRFPTLAAAAPYADNPEGLANRVYANRLGNGDGSQRGRVAVPGPRTHCSSPDGRTTGRPDSRSASALRGASRMTSKAPAGGPRRGAVLGLPRL